MVVFVNAYAEFVSSFFSDDDCSSRRRAGFAQNPLERGFSYSLGIVRRHRLVSVIWHSRWLTVPRYNDLGCRNSANPLSLHQG